MKPHSFTIDLLLLASILCASCAAPTTLSTSTPPATQTSIPTREATATLVLTPTPTESPLPAELPGDMAAIFKDISGKEIGEMSDAELVQFSTDHMKEVLERMDHFELTVDKDGNIDPEQLKDLMERGRQNIEKYNLVDVFNHMKNKAGKIVPIEQIVPEEWIRDTSYNYTGIKQYNRMQFNFAYYSPEPKNELGWYDYIKYYQNEMGTYPIRTLQTNNIIINFIDTNGNKITSAIASPVLFLDEDDDGKPKIINSYALTSTRAFSQILNLDPKILGIPWKKSNPWRMFSKNGFDGAGPHMLEDTQDSMIPVDTWFSDTELAKIIINNNSWMDATTISTSKRLPEEFSKTLFGLAQ